MNKLFRTLLLGVLSAMLAFTAFAFAACDKNAGNDGDSSDTPSIGYTVTFETFGGTQYSPLTTENVLQKVKLPTPERDGYAFDGWFDNEELEGEALGEYYLPTADVTIYAAWQAATFTVAFESNGGTEYEDVTVTGAAVNLPVPAKEHATFMGWYDNAEFTGSALSGAYVPAANVTLYAAWQEDVYYTVTFDSNGGTKHASYKDYGEGATLPEAFKYGYEFLGWYEDADLSGEALSGEYVATADVTLYAKYRKVTYLYLYYGQTGNYDRLSFAEKTTVNLADYTPAPLTIEGTECPFLKWEYDLYMGLDEAVPATITVADKDIYLVATYDTSALPAKDRLETLDDGSVRTTGNTAAVLIEEGTVPGAYSVDITIRKGKSGAANLAFRMTRSANDYAYEDAGTWYIAAGIDGTAGTPYACRVTNGAWSRLLSLDFGSAPKAWQTKWNSANGGDLVKFNMMVIDCGNYFDMYIDGAFTYRVDISAFSASFTGTGLGLRSSQTGAVYSDWATASIYKVTFNTNGGEAIADTVYGLGALVYETPVKEGYVFDGWYYDEALTNPVNDAAPEITSDVTLYAAWREARYSVTLMKNGEVYRVLGYEDGALNLPVLANEPNRIYGGWFYDQAFTQPVDEEYPEITSDVTLYAGWRLPTHSNVSGSMANGYFVGDGSSVSAVFAETDAPYNKYQATLNYTKGIGGAGGPAFRMRVLGDNSYEATSQYFATVVSPSSGSLGVISVNGLNGSSYARLTDNNSDLALTTLPASWQNKFNSTASGAQFTVTVTVIDYGSSFTVYLDDELAVTVTITTDPGNTFVRMYYPGQTASFSNFNRDVSSFDGKGFGIRSSSKNVTVKYAHTPAYDVSFSSDEGTVSKACFVGDAITETAPDTGVLTENDGAVGYRKIFKGWAYTQGGELVTTIAGPQTLYAVYERVDMITVSYDGDNGEALFYQYYNSGEDLVLPETSFKQGYTEGETTYGYTFIGWYDGDTVVEGGTVTENASYKAKYSLTTAHTVSFATNIEGYTLENAIVAEGETLTLPTASYEGYRLDGWYTDEAMTAAYTPAPVMTSFKLYAKFVKLVTVTFYNGETLVDTQIIDINATATLPVDQTKSGITKENGNTVTYTFAGWEDKDGAAVTDDTTYGADAAIYAIFEAHEKRRGADVTYDENGNAQYSWTGTPSGGFVLPGIEQKSGEFNFTLDTTFASNTVELRAVLFSNNEGQLVNIPGNDTDGYIFLDYYLASGRINLGSRITKTSGQPWGFAPDAIKDCAYKRYVTSLKIGDPLHVDFKIMYGVKDNGNGWIKAYLNGDLIIVYGLTEEELNGEPVYGNICTDANGGAAAARAKFVAWMEDVKYYKIGFTAWQSLAPAGNFMGMSNISVNPVYTVTAKNGTETVDTMLWSSGKLYAPEMTSSATSIFTGWYYDEACTNAVDLDNPVFASDANIYAGFEDAAYVVTLVKDGATYTEIGYTSGAIALPTLVNEPNKVFTGWYYDQACTNAVNADEPAITDNATLYAGWRTPTSSNLKYENGVYSVGTGSNVAAIIGFADDGVAEYVMNVSYVKKSGGAAGIIFREKLTGDNSYESTAQYLGAVVGPDSGGMDVLAVNYKYARLVPNVPLTSLPAAWQAKFNATAENEALSFTMKIIDYGTYFEVYIDGDLAFKSDPASNDISAFDGNGYGVRSSNKKLSFTMTYEKLLNVTYVDGDVTTKETVKPGAITKTLEDTGIISEGDSEYRMKFMGWSLTENGELVTEITSDATLYAVYAKVNVYTVTFDPDNGDEVITQKYDAGEALELPAAAFKQGYTENGTTYGYTFLGWYDGETAVTVGAVNANAAYAAKYEVAVAHTVSFATNIEGYTLENAIVAEGETLTLPTASYEGYRLEGWYTDEAMTAAYTAFPVTASFKLYAKFVKLVTVSFYNGETLVTSATVDQGATATLPAAQTKAGETKTNGNTLTYAFAGWEDKDGAAVTSGTTFGEDTSVYASYTVTEKRREAFVTYDENGSEIYTWTSQPTGGFRLPFEKIENGEFKVSMTSKRTTATTDFRLCLFMDTQGQLVNIPGNTTDGNIFLDYYLTSGQVNLGAKLTGNSDQPMAVNITDLKACGYKDYYYSTLPGDDFTVDFKVQYGVKADGSGYIKCYINDDLVLVYGLTAADLVGETLYGKVVTNTKTNTWGNKFNAWMSNVKYFDVGLNFWEPVTPIGDSLKFYATSLKPTYKVTYMNGTTALGTNFWAEGALAAPQLASTETSAFTGWYYDEACTLPVDVYAPAITADTTLYAGFAEPTYTVTLMKDGKQYSTIAYASGMLGTLPAIANESNRIFNGWYYDEACALPVDVYAPAITADTTLYAGWRLPKALLIEKDGAYYSSYVAQNTAAVFGTLENGIPAEGTYNEISETLVLPAFGSTGLAFRMDLKTDYAFETAGSSYIAVQVLAGGGLRASRVLNGQWKRLDPNNQDIGLTSLPQTWQDKYNAAGGKNVTVTLTVRDYGKYFEVYIDGTLAYTYGQNGETEDLTVYTGTGYGVRNSVANVTFKDVSAKSVAVEGN